MLTAAFSEVGPTLHLSTSFHGEEFLRRLTIPIVVEAGLVILVWKVQFLFADHRHTAATVIGQNCANNGATTRPKYPIGSKWQHQRKQ